MIQSGQDEVIGFLSEPSSREGDVDRVEMMQTHTSFVFLAGDLAIKLKRAVAYPYLDFSTPELRHQACEAELTLNRQTAPQLYLAVSAITRESSGALMFDGDGPALDWVVVMRRFDQSITLPRPQCSARL